MSTYITPSNKIPVAKKNNGTRNISYKQVPSSRKTKATIIISFFPFKFAAVSISKHPKRPAPDPPLSAETPPSQGTRRPSGSHRARLQVPTPPPCPRERAIPWQTCPASSVSSLFERCWGGELVFSWACGVRGVVDGVSHWTLMAGCLWKKREQSRQG